MSKKILYHGSTSIVKKPIYGGGKVTNDYGNGFYCTEDLELAKEWASNGFDIQGYVNKYEIDLSDLNVLNLNESPYTILNWIAVLVSNRKFSTTSTFAREAKEFLIKNYYIDISAFDIIIGYRADDSYFQYAKAFLNNTITKEALSESMRLGNLGNQIVLISQRAFERIKFVSAEEVNTYAYYSKRFIREQKAKRDYEKTSLIDGEDMRDILRRFKNVR